MSLVRSLIDKIDDLVQGIRLFFKRNISAYCDLETAIDSSMLVSRDGSLATVIHWNGSLRMIGPDEYDSIIGRINDRLAPSLKGVGHGLQVVFTSEGSESSSDSVLTQQFEGIRRAARKLKLDFEDVIEDRYRKLSELCSTESCYIVVWSHRSLLSPDESKTWRAKEMAERKDLPFGKRAQNAGAASLGIIDSHRSLVDLLSRELKENMMDATVLANHDALRAIRMHIDPEFTDANWQPLLPGDPLPAREALFGDDDLSNLLYPTLDSQLFPRPPTIHPRHVEIGDRLWAPVLVTLPPTKTYTFQDFFARMRGSKTPYRISFQISGSGMTLTSFNRGIASGFTAGSRRNRTINQSFESLKSVEDDGGAVVGFRIAACTWVRGSDVGLLRQRASTLARGLQAWGGCDTSEVPGNAMEALVSTIPGLMMSSASSVAAAPLQATLKFLPWHRPASPWDRGSQLLRSPDGKPYLFSPYSDLQDAWIALFFAPMGGGKSVSMSSSNLSLVLDENNEDLPLIRILDIGFSSSGFISLMQNALPPDQADRAVYRRLRMTRDCAINPADTMLGQRYPTAGHRSWLQGFLTLLCTPVGEGEKPVDGVSDLALRMIDKAYKSFADDPQSSPRKYAAGTNNLIDEALRRHGISVDSRTTWWEIEDALFKRDDIESATVAHRYAVPTLSEIASQARNPEIEAVYSSVRTPTQERLTEYTWRKLVDAIEAYPILAAETRFELGNSAIISLDLQEVAMGDSDSARRQAAVTYMLSLWVLSYDFFLGDEMLPDINPDYRPYHARRLAKLKRVPRRIVADELHRPAKAAPKVMDVLETFVREGRKWFLDIQLASQRHVDFPEAIVELASAIYIIKAPSTGADEIQKAFKLSTTEKFVVEKRLSGPSKEGAPFVVRYSTKRGTFTHHLVLSIGSLELWALSTSPRERVVRDALYKVAGPKRARAVLASKYPSGEITEEIKRRLKLRAGGSSTEEEDSVTDEIIAELSKTALAA